MSIEDAQEHYDQCRERREVAYRQQRDAMKVFYNACRDYDEARIILDEAKRRSHENPQSPQGEEAE